ncbi:hypothetical protein CYLTODRAFT_413671 [Cylindrobasidium torrendii FP15055 ss-10]|uniref:Uncharacterized protein n=1 Tax=Cylindrobasidium torrendii FP15055 ss-10 TaxID=1314674 RepID=A0A0D7B347_9AGAR|nr:hypothetical protein CYLTODRAFT_413671 [Cylindrobasidium torrendii FP15055 ss-10]
MFTVRCFPRHRRYIFPDALHRPPSTRRALAALASLALARATNATRSTSSRLVWHNNILHSPYAEVEYEDSCMMGCSTSKHQELLGIRFNKFPIEQETQNKRNGCCLLEQSASIMLAEGMEKSKTPFPEPLPMLSAPTSQFSSVSSEFSVIAVPVIKIVSIGRFCAQSLQSVPLSVKPWFGIKSTDQIHSRSVLPPAALLYLRPPAFEVRTEGFGKISFSLFIRNVRREFYLLQWIVKHERKGASEHTAAQVGSVSRRLRYCVQDQRICARHLDGGLFIHYDGITSKDPFKIKALPEISRDFRGLSG